MVKQRRSSGRATALLPQHPPSATPSGTRRVWNGAKLREFPQFDRSGSSWRVHCTFLSRQSAGTPAIWLRSSKPRCKCVRRPARATKRPSGGGSRFQAPMLSTMLRSKEVFTSENRVLLWSKGPSCHLAKKGECGTPSASGRGKDPPADLPGIYTTSGSRADARCYTDGGEASPSAFVISLWFAASKLVQCDKHFTLYTNG